MLHRVDIHWALLVVEAGEISTVVQELATGDTKILG